MRTKIYQKPLAKYFPNVKYELVRDHRYFSTFDIQKKENFPLLQSIVSSLQDIIVIFDKNHTVLHILGNCEEKIGIKPELLIGKTIFDILPTKIAEVHNEIYTRALNGYVDVFECEFFIKGKDTCFQTTLSPWKVKEEICGVIGIVRDITEQRNTQQQLRFQKVLLESQMETASHGILSVDTEGSVMSYNQSFLNLWGIDKDIMESKDDNFIIQTILEKVKEPENFLAKIKELYNSPDKKGKDEIYLHNGTVFERYTAPLSDDNNQHIGRVWFFHDITVHKNLEHQKELLLGMASHELKNNIASIKAFNQLVQKRVKDQHDEKSEEYLAKVDTKIHSITTLIQDLLDMTRIRTEKFELKKEVFNFDEFMDNFIAEITQTHTTHTLTKKDSNVGFIYADPEKLEQVFDNLVRNAIKYSPDANTVIIHIKKVKHSVVISIQDFGIGIPAEKLDSIFLPFERVEHANRSKFPGFGLGLYITSEIIKLHNGTISVESTLGKGSIFKIILPINTGA